MRPAKRLDPNALTAGGLSAAGSFLDDEVPDGEGVETADVEGSQGILGCAHDGLSGNVEARIEHHRDSREFFELVDQIPVARVRFPFNCLWTDSGFSFLMNLTFGEGHLKVCNQRASRQDLVDHMASSNMNGSRYAGCSK